MIVRGVEEGERKKGLEQVTLKLRWWGILSCFLLPSSQRALDVSSRDD
jgi:hypothetical protein